MKRTQLWRWASDPQHFSSVMILLIVIGGIFGAILGARVSSGLENDKLKSQVQVVAATAQSQDIATLSGTADDRATLSYQTLQSQLQKIKQDNSSIDRVYVLTTGQSGAVTFLASSSPEQDSSFVTPGTPYDKKMTFDILLEGTNFILKRHGSGLSAYAPVIDRQSQAVVAIVGIDTDATAYYGPIIVATVAPIILSILPLVGLLYGTRNQTKEQELLQLKNQFVSISSHELRSPLTGMMWAIQSLSRSGASRLNLEQLSMLGAMYHSVESSLATVNEILDFSIFDRGRAKIQQDPVDVVAVIKQVVATLSLSAREKRLIIEPIGKWPRHVYALGDVAALKRAYMNIFSNAIKYSTDATTIHITYQPGTNEHIIGIQDHGIGIPENEKTKVLEGYYRATNATAIEVHGTGLGLLVTKKIIEQHGGRVWLESEVGKGTTVFVSLPITHMDEPVGDEHQAQTEVGSTIPAPAESVDSATPAPDLPSKDTPLPPQPTHG